MKGRNEIQVNDTEKQVLRMCSAVPASGSWYRPSLRGHQVGAQMALLFLLLLAPLSFLPGSFLSSFPSPETGLLLLCVCDVAAHVIDDRVGLS